MTQPLPFGYVVQGYVSPFPILPDRIYAQYRNKPKAVAWYGITPTQSLQLGYAAQSVRNMYDIDHNSGAQLDVIGRIVGIPREYIQTIKLDVPQFNPDGKHQFGPRGAQFSTPELNDIESELADSFYRLVILAKIMRNTGDATIESIVAGLNVMLGERDIVQLIDNEDMTFDLHFLRPLNDIERSVITQLNIIQKPAGVKIRNITEA